MSSAPPTLPPVPYRRTPLLPSPVLSRAASCQIYLKLENLQPSSSFKSRGVGNLIHSVIVSHLQSADPSSTSTPPPPPKLHFYCSSGGNAGLAAVTAAAQLGYPCTVVVPVSTEASMVAKLRAAGARAVVVHGESWQFADAHMREVVMEEARAQGVEAVYVPPFDDARVWEGAESLVNEVFEQWQGKERGEKPDAVVCSVGGGGLLVGIVQAVEKVGWANGPRATKVVAVETKGAESLNYALRQGEVATLPGGITSVAKSLGAVRVAPRALEVAQRENVESLVISDAEACMGAWRFADDERYLVEPACGAAVALAYLPEKLKEAVGEGFGPESKVVIVVCGGSRIDLDTMNEYRERFAPEVERMGLALNGTSKRTAEDVANGIEEVPSKLTSV